MSSISFATPAAAADHFAARLSHETDVSDVHAALRADDGAFVLVDSRGDAAWRQGRLPGALHLPTSRIATEAARLIPPGQAVVTYCWGPGCNGATRAALEFARLGHPVKEMIGGYEYWVREGLPVETAAGAITLPVDVLTAPAPALAHGPSCDC